MRICVIISLNLVVRMSSYNTEQTKNKMVFLAFLICGIYWTCKVIPITTKYFSGPPVISTTIFVKEYPSERRERLVKEYTLTYKNSSARYPAEISCNGTSVKQFNDEPFRVCEVEKVLGVKE